MTHMLKMVWATATRVLLQLKHDPRTIALVFFLPALIVFILRFVFDDAQHIYDAAAPLVLAIMAFGSMAVVTSIATLRERRIGTFERLMSLPIGRLDIIFGYALAFGILSLVQSGIAVWVMFGLFDVALAGSIGAVLAVSIAAGLTGMAFGLFLSEFANTEFQAVQIFPAFVIPQLLICGLFIPREQMADGLQWLARIMPVTYTVDGMRAAMTTTGVSADLLNNMLVLAVFGFGALILGALTMRRQS